MKTTEGKVLPPTKAHVKAPADYAQISLKCDPGNVYVINDLSGQRLTQISFEVDIAGPQSTRTQSVSMNVSIKYLECLPIVISLANDERIGQLRKFTLAADPGEFAGIDQSAGEGGKSYSWHVIWAHNSLRFP